MAIVLGGTLQALADTGDVNTALLEQGVRLDEVPGLRSRDGRAVDIPVGASVLLVGGTHNAADIE
jgi:hypothetical protein